MSLNPAYLPDQSQFDAPRADLHETRIEAAIHEQVNEIRAEQGLRPLVYDDELEQIGRYHSADMAQSDYVGHESPRGEGVRDRYERFDYDCRIRLQGSNVIHGGENVFFIRFGGVDYTDEDIANRAVEGWLNSTGHRENLLADHWFRQGVGVTVLEEETGNFSVYVTQNFC